MASLFNNRNRFLWLVFASLALLASSQVAWLRSVWREQREALQKETDILFMQAVFAVQDSIVAKQFMSADIPPPPSFHPKLRPKETIEAMYITKSPHTNDSFKRVSYNRSIFHNDTIGVPFEGKPSITIQIKDSISVSSKSSGISRFLLHMRPEKSDFKAPNQIIFVGQSVIPKAPLRAAYVASLQKARIPLQFEVVASDSARIDSTRHMITAPVAAGFLTEQTYSAVLYGHRLFLLQRLAPYILFSLLLLGVTAAAFWVIYRHLAEQQRLARIKSEFISNITHELKTPITTVGVALEALSDFAVLSNPAQTKEYLSISKLELGRLSLLVEKVLRHSMFEQQEPTLNTEKIDLGELTRQVSEALKLQAEQAGAQVRIDIPPGEDLTIEGDRLHLTSVAFNLLDNALKYVRPGVAPEIDIRLRREGDTATLVVADNGAGIAPEYRSKVFEKFFRVPSGNRHNVKGHGLGLSYVAKVTEQHGGTISVDSTPGSGSVFTVRLPVHFSK